MNIGFVKIIYIVILEVVFVKSECDSYSGCLQQIYDGFGSFINFETTDTQVGDIKVPGFQNVNIESDNVDSILKTVAGFLKELVGDLNLNSHFNISHNIDNKASIFVTTFNISDDFEDSDDVTIKLENKTHENNLSGIKVTSTERNIELSTKIQINGITQQSTVNIKTNVDNTRYPILDINELSKRVKQNEIIDTDSYDDINDNSTDYPIIDYIDLYKDTTNEYVEIKPTAISTYGINEMEKNTTPLDNNLLNVNTNNRVYTEECANATDTADAVFPWVAAIFIKNGTSNQFNYYCDGALLSETVIITAASCIQTSNSTTEDILVILGKRSLKATTENEIIAKVKDVHTHDNFTGMDQDIALLVMKVPVTLSDRVEPAHLSGDDSGKESATTGWAISGELTLILLKEEKHNCVNNNLPMNTFCAVYGNDVAVCPSFGGIYVTRQSNGWFLSGIRTAEQTSNGLCVDRTLVYTDLKYYSDWINLYVK